MTGEIWSKAYRNRRSLEPFRVIGLDEASKFCVVTVSEYVGANLRHNCAPLR